MSSSDQYKKIKHLFQMRKSQVNRGQRKTSDRLRMQED